jgi:uncharacterized protein YhjY with autotransporter beta-barrel domain
MILQNLTPKSRHPVSASVLVIGFIQFCMLGEPFAQTLNQQVDQLLANDCEALTIGNNAALIGSNLQNLCNIGGTQTGFSGASSTGGGAASVQGAAASILNRVLLQRLDEIDEEEGQAHIRSASMRLNPFSALLSGFGRSSSVSSPLYATTFGDSSTSAAFSTSSHSRWNGLGLFASGLVESLNRDITTFQDGYKSNIFGFTGGADYRFTRKLVAGLALSYSNTDGDFRSGGHFSTNSYGGLLFASYLPSDKTFMQVTAGYTRNNYLVARSASATITNQLNIITTATSGLASSNSHGNVFNLGLMTGYDHPIGRFTIGPRAGVNYSNTKIGDYGERGSTGVELRYDDQWINSLQSVLGIQGSAAFSTSLGVLVPQFNADFIHEFANSQRFITVQFAEDFRDNPTKFRFQNDVPVRNYFNLGTGLMMVLPNGWQPFVNFRAMVGNEQFNNYAGTFGLRIEL